MSIKAKKNLLSPKDIPHTPKRNTKNNFMKT